MIKATEAQANVINYETAIREDIKRKVDDMAEIMSKSIKYHSQNGFTSAAFTPYEKSRFANIKALEYAQELFQKIFEDAGFEVLENNYGKNSIIIKW